MKIKSQFCNPVLFFIYFRIQNTKQVSFVVREMKPKLFDLLLKKAKTEKIEVQINAEPQGTDANAMQLSRTSVSTCLVSIPLRYMISLCELMHLKDIGNCAKLIAKTVEIIILRISFIPFSRDVRVVI